MTRGYSLRRYLSYAAHLNNIGGEGLTWNRSKCLQGISRSSCTASAFLTSKTARRGLSLAYKGAAGPPTAQLGFNSINHWPFNFNSTLLTRRCILRWHQPSSSVGRSRPGTSFPVPLSVSLLVISYQPMASLRAASLTPSCFLFESTHMSVVGPVLQNYYRAGPNF